MNVPSEDVLVLRARPAAVIALASIVLAACAAGALALPEYHFWCAVTAVGAVGWAVWRIRREERFKVDFERRLLERSGAPPLDLRAASGVVVKDPEQEAPTIAAVMVDLGGERWVPVFHGDPADAARVGDFLGKALARMRAAPPEASARATSPAPPVSAPAGPAVSAPSPPKRRIETVRGIYDAAVAARRSKAPAERVVVVVQRFDRERTHSAECFGEGAGRYLALLQGFERSGPPPTPWIPVSHHEARNTLAAALGRELAYGYELLPDVESFALADDFLRLFEKDVAYFGVPAHVRISAHAAIDTGVVVRDRDGLGLCWFEGDNPGR